MHDGFDRIAALVSNTALIMIKNTCILVFACFSFSFLFAADTLHVVSHKEVTVVTDPTTGGKSYKSWVVFPSAKTDIRKINLNVIFGCPNTMRCADWDYLDRIYIRRRGGVNATSMDYEIGHMLTPYGGAFAKSWGFQWQVNITDFSMLLRDSVEIEYFHTGYEPNEDRGWKITVDFEIIKGKPAIEPIAIHKLYDGSYRYGDSTNNIENHLKPFTFKANTRADLARIFVYHTGHGSDASGCSEFCTRYREIWFDGRLIDKRDMWKKCGDNPLYPQAGTWLIDRAYWCPGELQQPDIFDVPLTAKGSDHSFDINMQPFATPKPSADEVIVAYVFEYGKPSAAYDVAVEDIIVPTNKQVHGRKNPSSINPVVVIKNNGSQILRHVTIQYGTKGFPLKQYNWTGRLAFNEKAIVTLPATIDAKEGQNQFTVNLLSPNGKKDRFKDDNFMLAAFTKAQVHGTNLVLNLRTNNQPEQNGYVVRDQSGKIFYERKTGSLQANKDYRDTLKLAPGKYELVVEDTAGNGLEFWFNTRGGRGLCRLLDSKGNLLKHFESDFGNFIHYGFEITDDSTLFAAPLAEPSIGLFPTRTTGKTTLDYFSNQAQKVTVKIVTDPGDNVIEEHVYESLKEAVLEYDLSYRPAQRYYVKVFIGDKLLFNKRLRVEEMRRRREN
jgi:hypothetical protein